MKGTMVDGVSVAAFIVIPSNDPPCQQLEAIRICESVFWGRSELESHHSVCFEQSHATTMPSVRSMQRSMGEKSVSFFSFLILTL
jgi:hypothetical protein